MDEENIKIELEKFIMDNDLEKLEKILDRFNMYDVINRNHDEQVHSEVLSWLLDPYENHGLGDSFLKLFLKDVLRYNRDHPYALLSPISIDIRNFSNAIVQTEEVFPNKRRADITINSDDGKEKLYILIENKLLSEESDEQTKAYVIEAEKRYPNHKRLYIFLTPELKDAESEKYLLYSYMKFVELLSDFLTNNDELNENARFIISQLKWNLEVNILEESDIEQLCVQIYEKHKKAIDKIIQIKPTNKSLYQALGFETLKELGDEWTMHFGGSFCSIFKKEWNQKYHPGKPYCFFDYEFDSIEYGYLRIAFQIMSVSGQDYREPFKDALKRTNLVNDERFDLSKANTLMSRRIQGNLTNDQDTVFNTGVSEMVKLIKSTAEYIENAVNNFTP